MVSVRQGEVVRRAIQRTGRTNLSVSSCDRRGCGFTQRNLDELPVVDGATQQLVGMLRRKDAIAVYNRRLAEQKRQSLEQS